MSLIAFAEWTPDLGALGNAGVLMARNCIPQARGYRCFPGLATYAGPNALPDRIVGATSAKDKDGNTINYAGTRGAGNQARLFQLVASSWQDKSGTGSDGTPGYGVNDGEGWEFVKWGESMLATTISEPLQQHGFGASTFANAITSDRRPRARHIAVIRDFVVLGNIDDSIGVGADGLKPSRVWWSGINNVATFEEGGALTQSDFQDLQSGGGVQRIVGGETGTVFCETSIYRMTYVGAPVVFQFDEIERNRGVWVPGSVATAGRLTFFLDRDGWYAWDGQTSTSIGVDKIDRTFLGGADGIDLAHLDRVSAVADPVNHLYYCAYPSVNASGGIPDRVLVFDWINRKWSLAEIQVDYLFRAFSEGYTLDSLDTIGGSLDAINASLDSSVYTGRNVSLAAFNGDHAFCFFSGSPLGALIDTGEVQLEREAGARAVVTSVRPIVDGANAVSVQPLTRDLQTQAPQPGSVAVMDQAGECRLRSNARYHRFRVRIEGSFTAAHGVEVSQMAASGRR
jgi:hypothetical protein